MEKNEKIELEFLNKLREITTTRLESTKTDIVFSGQRVNSQTLKLNRYSDTSKLRKHSAYWVMIVVSFWLFLVVGIVFLCGFTVMNLEASVIIALLTTTTANILGLPLIILQGLYPKEKEMEKIDNEIKELKDKEKDNQQ